MRTSIMCSAAILAAAAADRAPAQTRGAAPVPAPVRQWLAERQRECLAERGLFSARDYFLTADFNADGKPDYVVSQGGLDCRTKSGMSPFAYGSAGPGNDFIVSGPAGYRTVDGFMGDIGPENIERRGDRDVIVLKGPWRMANGIETTAVWGWTGTTMELVSRTDPQGRELDDDGRPVAGTARPAHAGGAPQAADPALASLLRGIVGVREARCRADRRRSVSILPGLLTPADFNGDGRDDYVLRHRSISCTAYDDQFENDISILMSLPEGVREVARLFSEGGRHSVDTSVRPNRLRIARAGRTGDDLMGWNGGAWVQLSSMTQFSPPAGAGFTVTVRFNPSGLRDLVDSSARLSVLFFGAPKPGAPDSEEGELYLGEQELLIPPGGGMVKVDESGLNRGLIRYVEGPVRVGFFVINAKRHSTASPAFMACTPESSPPLAALRRAPLTLTCAAVPQGG